MSNFSLLRQSGRAISLITLAGLLIFSTTLLMAQSTVSTGSITGTVTDQSGAVVAGAKVTITNAGTNQSIDLTTNSSGSFNSGPVAPGTYQVQVSFKGFNTIGQRTGAGWNTSSANIKMQVGQESQTVEVQASDVAVNTIERASVQGVLNSPQIENLGERAELPGARATGTWSSDPGRTEFRSNQGGLFFDIVRWTVWPHSAYQCGRR